MLVGAYLGNQKNDNDKLIATQYINLYQADIWEQAGGSNVAESIMHEIDESLIGAFLFPNVNFNNSSDEDFKKSYTISHKIIRDIFEKGQYYPKLGQNEKGTKIYLIGEDNVIYDLYEESNKLKNKK